MRSGFKNRELIFGSDQVLTLFCPDILINDNQLCSRFCVCILENLCIQEASTII